MSKASVLLLFVLMACGSIPTKTFEIRAIDTNGTPVKCLIVVDRKWPKPEEAVFTDGEVTIPFRRNRMSVHVQWVRMRDGAPVVPSPDDVGRYHMVGRDLELTDPRVHLFILQENPSFGG